MTAAAWNAFRGEFVLVIQDALQCGVRWPSLLRALHLALLREETGHPRLAQYVKAAVTDSELSSYPVLHADVLLWKLDASFGMGSAEYAHDSLSADWERCVSRLAGEDAVTLAERVQDAFVKRLNDPTIDATSVWTRTSHAHEINERFSDCLFEDLGCPERGQFNQFLFNREWLTARERFDLGEIPLRHTTCDYIARVYITANESAVALCGYDLARMTNGMDLEMTQRRPSGRGARARRIERRASLQQIKE